MAPINLNSVNSFSNSSYLNPPDKSDRIPQQEVIDKKILPERKDNRL